MEYRDPYELNYNERQVNISNMLGTSYLLHLEYLSFVPVRRRIYTYDHINCNNIPQVKKNRNFNFVHSLVLKIIVSFFHNFTVFVKFT